MRLGKSGLKHIFPRDSQITRLLREEMTSIHRMYSLSTRLLASHNVHTALNEVLEASLTMLHSNMGSIQLHDIHQDTLQLAACRGFTDSFLDFFNELNSSVVTPCNNALRTRKRVVTENIRTDPLYAHCRSRAAEAGIFGVQSTPLINRDNVVLGVISTHFSKPHLPSVQELHMLDLYAQQVVDLLDRLHVDEALRTSEAKFRTLTETSPALIWQLDAHCKLIYLNERYQSIFGMSPAGVLNANWQNSLEIKAALESLLDIARNQPEHTIIRRSFNLHDKNGKPVILDTRAQPWFDANNEFAGLIGVSMDITDSIHTQHELHISNERLKLAIEGAGDGVWDWDIASGQASLSYRFQEIMGFNHQEVSISNEEWLAHVHPDDLPRVQSAIAACLHGQVPIYNCEYRVKSGNDWIWLLARAIVVARDSDGIALRMTGTISDISEKKQIDETIWQHANFDMLTGLPNRRLFRDRLNQQIRKAQRTKLPLALFFIDLDRFKQANDLLGHDVGDQLLTEAAKRIGSCVRESDTVARLGGDEFTAILSDLDDVAHIEQCAQKIINILAQPFHLCSEVVYLSASLGITLYPADADNAESLIRNADQAMYAAKSAGRNRFSYFMPSMQENAQARLRLIGDLRNALAHGQLKVHYQPVIDLSTGNIIKAEALLRWQHPQLGLIESSQFIPIAEESGLIHEIGNWVFTVAASCSQRWSALTGVPLQISVNKSPVQFLSQHKDMDWPEYLRKQGIPGTNLAIEITENLLLDASDEISEKLLQYRNAGIEVAIDDFGTGYSSMIYLKKFDIDYLKIDRSFVADMAHDADSLTIVKTIIVMAHELAIKVIAEGIETEEQKQLLIKAGCDFGQGYLFSQPLPAEHFESLLLQGGNYAGTGIASD